MKSVASIPPVVQHIQRLQLIHVRTAQLVYHCTIQRRKQHRLIPVMIPIPVRPRRKSFAQLMFILLVLQKHFARPRNHAARKPCKPRQASIP